MFLWLSVWEVKDSLNWVDGKSLSEKDWKCFEERVLLMLSVKVLCCDLEVPVSS